jgi:hypothetical protein
MANLLDVESCSLAIMLKIDLVSVKEVVNYAGMTANDRLKFFREVAGRVKDFNKPVRVSANNPASPLDFTEPTERTADFTGPKKLADDDRRNLQDLVADAWRSNGHSKSYYYSAVDLQSLLFTLAESPARRSEFLQLLDDQIAAKVELTGHDLEPEPEEDHSTPPPEYPEDPEELPL